MSINKTFFGSFLVLSLMLLVPLSAAENLIFTGNANLGSFAVFCTEYCYFVLKPLTWISMMTLVGVTVLLKKKKELSNS